MPRADSKQHLGTQFYHSQFSNSPYLQESLASPPQISQSSPQSSTPPATTAPKKKHVCGTCERAFTTSGHLARHSRVHTGERNHKCPFPGCETRCSRQDNLQQHYRIHLSPGSRRSSARSAASKTMNGKKSNSSVTTSSEPPSAPPPLSPPPLETARIYSHHSTPPDSPPPLTQATLPATASIPLTSSRMQQPSPGRSSSSSSPDTAYPPSDHHLLSLQSQGLSTPNYNYRSGTTTYQEQSQGPGYTYVHTTPITHPSSGPSNGNSFSSYSNSHDNFSLSPIQPQQAQNEHRDNSPVSISSRHSISHISHPQSSYQSSAASPPSPTSSQSVSSHNSGPPTPNYSVFHDDAHSYHHHHQQQQQHSQHHGNGMMNNHHHHQQQHHHPQSHLVPQHNGNHYHSNGHNTGRFNSPPPTLAPIQGERLIRRDDSRHNHSTSPYIHSQPVGDYPYHQGMGLGHGAWKAESGMRKGLGTALV